MRIHFPAAGLLLATLASCATRPAPEPAQAEAAAAPAAPMRTRGEFVLAADKLDTWNAVGQIVVRLPEAVYDGRSQMMDLYSVRYRDEPFLLITRGLPLAGGDTVTATRVTAASLQGGPIDSDAAADLLALLERELPAEIERVRAQQAAEKQAAKRKPKRK
jgi:hypothetical protein